MPRLLNILLGFALFASLAIGGVAHAAEDACMPGGEVAAIGHMDGDTDQTTHGDGDYSHHHGGCHGHHNVAAVENGTALPVIATGSVAGAFESTIGASSPPGADLRPPIA